MEARVPDYTNDELARGYPYEHVIPSRLGLGIGVKDLRVLMVKHGVAAWMQLRLSQIPNITVPHATLGEFGSVPHAAQILLSTAFDGPPVRTLRYISGAVRGRTEGPTGLTRRHHISSAVGMEIALRVTEPLVAEFAARVRVKLLDEPIT